MYRFTKKRQMKSIVWRFRKEEKKDEKGSANSTHKLSEILGNSSIFQIGKGNWGSGELLKGYIDEFKIYEGALTETEIAENYKASRANALEKDLKKLTIPNADQIRGNINLPSKGAYGSDITWKSDQPSVISDEASQNENYDSTPAGVVHRQATDTKVKLTATLSYEGETKTKEFEVTVKAASEQKETTDYLFAYFIGNNPGEEEIYFATSRDGENWTELNSGKPVLESTMGTTGLRDPFIIRSAEGDKFYLIATDLRICTDWDWGKAQTGGSQAIMVWESEDLVHWSDQRMVNVSGAIGAGCTWAPEAFYDDKTGEYIVFWASKVAEDNYGKQRLYYSKTRDFYSFTEPKVWIDRSVSTIDTTVTKGTDGYYYRFSKNEGSGTVDGESVTQSTIFLQKSKTLLGDWENVPSASLKSQGGVEGPTCFKFNSDDKEQDTWCLLLDNFGGGGYYPLMTESLSTAEFTKISANLPKKPRHGTIMNITSEEYDAVMAAYGDVVISEESVPSVILSGNVPALPNQVDVTIEGTNQKLTQQEIVWDEIAEEAFDNEGTVRVTGTLTSMNKKVSKEIAVVDKNTIYYIDSASPQSSSYQKISSVANQLKNEAADQMYTEGSWGYVNDAEGTILGEKTAAGDTIYTNGWWAKSGKNCEYILPLEAGNYSITGYFAEWWSVTRPMKCYVTYVDRDGTTKKSEEASLTLTGAAPNQTATLNFTVENVDKETEVHFIVEKTGSSDPVISGLSVKSLWGKVSSVTLNRTEAMLKIGDKFTLEAEAEPSTAENTKVIFSSSNEAVVSVNKYTGEVTANAVGKAVITASARDGGGASASCQVTVTKTGEVDLSGIYAEFGASGSQNSEADTSWLIATNNYTDPKQSAAHSSDTATKTGCNLGSARIGCLIFDFPSDVDPKMIKSATVHMNVQSVNGNIGDGYTKAGLFLVDKDPSEIKFTDESTYPAKNNDYSAAATAFCKEWIGEDNLGEKTFDVTDLLLDQTKDSVIFRLQTVIAGFNVTKSGEKAPYLSVELYQNKDEVFEAEVSNLSIDTELSGNIALPSSTKRGSVITWKSSDTSVIADDGTVVPNKEEKKATLTATVTYEGKTDTKAFEVTVAADPAKITEADAEELNLPAKTETNLTLPSKGTYGSTITWASSNTNVISRTGAVILPAEEIVVVLTATIRKGSAKTTKTFQIKVPAAKQEEEKKGDNTQDGGNQNASGQDTAAQKIEAAEKLLDAAKVTPEKKTIYLGKTTKLVVVYPSGLNAALTNAGLKIKSVTYTPLSKKVISVSKKGEVTSKKKGTSKVSIVISLSNGTSKTLTSVIKVKKPTIKILGKSTVARGKSIQLKAKKYGVAGTVKWSVSKKNLATISKTGKLKAKRKKGTVIVTASVKSSGKTVKKTKKIKIK